MKGFQTLSHCRTLYGESPWRAIDAFVLLFPVVKVAFYAQRTENGLHMISIVLPCFNEEENITATVQDVLEWFTSSKREGEVIIVDDGSRDRSGAIADELSQKDPRIRVVHHKGNKGYGAAVRSGCDAARGEWIGFMDSDRQFRAADFEKLIPFMSESQFVTGLRRHRADPFIRKVNAKLFGGLVFITLGMWIRDINCAMKLFTADLWKQIRPEYSTGALFNAEVFYALKLLKVPYKQVSVPHYPREFGTQTGAKPWVIFRMFLELAKLRVRVKK